MAKHTDNAAAARNAQVADRAPDTAAPAAAAAAAPPKRRIFALVRGIPYPPHKQRYASQMEWTPDPTTKKPRGVHGVPWPAAEIRVEVVDKPAPFDPGVGVATEISPRQVAELRKDLRIAVQIVGEGSQEAAETVDLKTAKAKLEEELDDTRRDLQRVAEERERYKEQTEERAKESALRIVELESELAAAHSMLGTKAAEQRGTTAGSPTE